MIIPKTVDFEDAAKQINTYVENGYQITAAILQADDGVLVHNRLNHKIPIVDEVGFIDKVPVDMLAAVEVAAPEKSLKPFLIHMVLQPYFI